MIENMIIYFLKKYSSKCVKFDFVVGKGKNNGKKMICFLEEYSSVRDEMIEYKTIYFLEEYFREIH